jgi:hypothetical protein
MINPYELSIEDLEQLIANTPAISNCVRAQLEQYQQVLNMKKEQLNATIGDS